MKTAGLLIAALFLAGAGWSGDSERVILGFENPRDAAIWEAPKGPALELSTEHATEGKQSLKLASGSYITSWQLYGEWLGYESMEFDAFNATGGVVEGYLLVGDKAWKEKGSSYWNRHNGSFNLNPGANTVSIPVSGLYRGEAGSRNNDIRRNIDPGEITRLDLGFTGGPGSIYLDRVRLVKSDRPASVRAFDFGPESQTVAPGFTPVSWNTVYTKAAGYGLERKQYDPNRARDDTFPSRLLSDWLTIETGDFRVDLPDGKYRVWAVFNDCGYWGGEYARHTKRGITAEGQVAVAEDRGAHGGPWEPMYLFQDTEPRPGDDAASLYYDRLFRPRVFDVPVVDGQLNLGFSADAPFSTKLAALMVCGADDAAGRAWVEGALQGSRDEFKSRAPEIPPPDTGSIGDVPLAERNRGYILFTPRDDETIFMNHIPAPDRIRFPLGTAGTLGEVVSVTFAIRPLKPLGSAKVESSSLVAREGVIPASAIKVRAVRHLAKRGYNTIRYRITPWYLADFGSIDLVVDLTRQFLVTVAIPANVPAGHYAGNIRITATGLDEIVPVNILVDPFTLDENLFPVGFYGMQEDWLAFMKEYGMTAVSGGPNIGFDGLDSRGRPKFDFAAVDRYMDAIRAAGYRGKVLTYGGPTTIDGIGYEGITGQFAEWGKPAGLSAEQAGKRAFDELRRHAKEKNWLPFVFPMCDEPRVRETTARIIESCQYLKKVAPWMTLAGSYSVDFKDKKDEILEQALFSRLDVPILNNHDELAMAEGRKQGKEIMIYNQGRSRYTFGAYLWSEKSKGVRGFLQWHMFATHGYQFFDLDGREPDDGIIVVRTDGIFPTLDLERVRTGVYDFRYFSTLSGLAAKARKAGKAAEAVKAEAVLDGFTARLKVGENEKPDWLDPDVLRRQTAEEIIRLRSVLGAGK